MKQWEQKAIELKYKGKTAREIASEISKLFTFTVNEGTVANIFAVDGRLYIPYLTYEAEQNKWTDEHSRQQYKKMAGWTAKAQQQLYKEAVKKGDYRLAWDIIKDINDRAGFVVVRKSEVNIEDKEIKPIDNYEQFAADLRRKGIDPGTGLRMATPAMEKN